MPTSFLLSLTKKNANRKVENYELHNNAHNFVLLNIVARKTAFIFVLSGCKHELMFSKINILFEEIVPNNKLQKFEDD